MISEAEAKRSPTLKVFNMPDRNQIKLTAEVHGRCKLQRIVSGLEVSLEQSKFK